MFLSCGDVGGDGWVGGGTNSIENPIRFLRKYLFLSIFAYLVVVRKFCRCDIEKKLPK